MENIFIILLGLTMIYISATSRLVAHVNMLVAQGWLLFFVCLSGFAKEDKLVPVITLTIYWNTGIWDGARSLHEMLDVQETDILKFVSYNLVFKFLYEPLIETYISISENIQNPAIINAYNKNFFILAIYFSYLLF